MCTSGIHYEFQNELEEDLIEVDPKLICKYSGLLSISGYEKL